jgi:hypothetical protein
VTDNRVTVRLARKDDVERAAELATQLGYRSTPEEMRRRLAQVGWVEDHAIYVAELYGRVVGWIHLACILRKLT